MRPFYQPQTAMAWDEINRKIQERKIQEKDTRLDIAMIQKIGRKRNIRYDKKSKKESKNINN